MRDLLKYSLIIYVITNFASCLNEKDVATNPNIELNTAELMIHKLESNGDYINSIDNPSFIDAKEVYENLNNYLIIDIRNETDFSNGRIEGSVNILAPNLLDYIKGIDYSNYEKIVIVSATGQHASYCTSLLQLLEYDNVYSLHFGIAIWNSEFAQPWINSVNNLKDDAFGSTGYGFKYTEQHQTPLPNHEKVSISEIDSYLETRVSEVLNLDYIEDQTNFGETDLSVDYKYFDENYFVWLQIYGTSVKVLVNGAYLACYGSSDLYLVTNRDAHPPQTAIIRLLNENNSGLRTSERLQYLPNDSKIFLYSVNGHRSAYAVAFLRILGYEAKSIAFGSHSFQYDDLVQKEPLRNDTFTKDKIYNYPYIK